MAPTPAEIFRELTTREPVRLDTLPHDHGIYALHDHTGSIRYVGITMDDKSGLRGRIYGRHVTGSEGRSHKFSHAYNTGRMWQARRDKRPDAKAAKSLRAAFARQYCRATFVTVPPAHFGDLPALETAVQAMFAVGVLDWGNARSFAPLPEPRELVETLMDALRYPPDMRAAVERQAALHASA